MPQIYDRPELDTKPVDLVPQGLGGEELTPKTRVVCINRDRKPYIDKYDGHDYICPPGLFEVAYEVAAHFRERSVIPGSRDPITGRTDCYIRILGIDDAELCLPLTKQAAQTADAAPEALDRSMMDGADKDVKVVTTQAARARTAGGSRRLQQEVTAPGATQAPEGGEALNQIHRDAGHAGEGDEA